MKPASIPSTARLGINRCNLPAVILGSLTYQKHPAPLFIDGVQQLHADFFKSIDMISHQQERAYHFQAYMSSSFLLDHLDEAGLSSYQGRSRENADYLRMLRGWMFNADGKEAAVLKSWVESRFGLLARRHHGMLLDYMGENYQMYLAERSMGLYNTNSLEAQLDLLYSYCQYEAQRHFDERHITLFRGVNRIDEFERLSESSSDNEILILNNLNSFTASRERADEFGDLVIRAEVPIPKLLYYQGLLPGPLQGEEEFLVIGGAYAVTRC